VNNGLDVPIEPWRAHSEPAATVAQRLASLRVRGIWDSSRWRRPRSSMLKSVVNQDRSTS